MCVYILWCKFTNFRWKDKDFYYLSNVLWLVLAFFSLCRNVFALDRYEKADK